MMQRLTGFLIVVFCTAACSKDVMPENFLIARIDGKNWNSNVANSENTMVAATISQGSVTLAGVQEQGDYRTAIGILFPENVTAGKEYEINPASQIILAYTVSATEAYLVDPAKGGSGKLKVTVLDQANKQVEGFFSGEAVNTQNGRKIKIANGNFRSKLYATVKTTSPGKK